MYEGMDHGQEGGGFFSSQPAAAGAASESPSKAQRGPNKPLTPLTIKQLLTASQGPDEAFRVDGVELVQITLLGRCRTVDEKATHITLTLEDGTGQIDVRVWFDREDGAGGLQAQKHTWREGVYLRVFGHLRTWEGTRSVVAFRVQTVDDLNEMTFHFLDVMHTHMFRMHGPPASQAVGAGAPVAQGGVPAGNGYGRGQSAANGYGAMAMGGGGGSGGNSAEAVLHTIKKMGTNSGDRGVSLEDIKTHLPQMALGDIRTAIEFLKSEGHVYSTLDDHHFKSTD